MLIGKLEWGNIDTEIIILFLQCKEDIEETRLIRAQQDRLYAECLATDQAKNKMKVWYILGKQEEHT